jgi:hypothetical protein
MKKAIEREKITTSEIETENESRVKRDFILIGIPTMLMIFEKI